jgi:cystathionine beta-synthase (O-acetyl-L-serine)
MATTLLTKPPRPVSSIIDLIGGTPMLELRRIAVPGSARIVAKLEYMTPGFSVKDRLGIGLIRAAEDSGLLGEGGTIVEPTAGNTGIALALVGRQLGYRVILVVPENFSIEKRKLMAALGGEVVLTSEEGGMRGAIQKAKDLAAEIPGAYVPQQFENPSNPEVHYQTTGMEIYEQMEGKIDAFVTGSGTGGTFTGVVRYLREKIPHLRAVVVEPEGSVLQGGEPGPHDVEGIGSSFIPGTLDLELADEIMMIDDPPAFAMVRRLASEEGILCGSSAGANVVAALRVAKELGEGKSVVTIIPDSSERYLSKGIYDKNYDQE